VVLLGYGDGAREVGRGLRARQVPFVVTTLNPDGAAEAEARGWDVIRGDSTKHHVLVEAGVPRARMVVIGDDDAEMAARQTSVVRGLAPDATVVVRVDGNADLAMLAEAGVDKLVDATHSSATALSDSVRASIADGSRGERMIDPSRVVRYGLDPDGACPHLPDVAAVLPSAAGCEDCLRTGEDWVHLRLCLTCGHVGCCDSSPNRHARTHADERWGWCYIDELELASAPDRGAGRT
jgi:CPA2 family monovalent cation:H+ antiporter-2